MSEIGAPRHDPVPIGDVANPPFVRLPDPIHLFKVRADRLRLLAPSHKLGPYLGFLAEIAGAQHDIQDGLPVSEAPAKDATERAREFGMPPLDRSRFVIDPVLETTLDRLFAVASDAQMPDAARAALDNVIAADKATRDVMIRNVLADAVPVESMAQHVFVAAALQVHFSRIAAQLDGDRLVPVGDGVCPVCGGPPVASLIVGWPGAANTRYCTCALCETWWHYVRIRCTVCGSTKGIGYKVIDGQNDVVQAETCDECQSFVKIMHQHRDPLLEPFADDVATLALDMLVREAGYRRGAFNPFLLGY